MEGSSRRRRSAILTALCTFFALALSSSAQEFLSIDCGADVGRTDEAGIKWVTDDGYVKTGRNREIRETGTAVQLGSPDFSLTSAFTYPTARVFTEKRSKHCYVLPVQKNSTNLSDKNLTGPIPDAIVELTQLQKIRLDNNQLNGTIPQSLRTLRNLQLLALDNNNLSGDIPAAFVDKAGFTFSGNPGICQVGGNCNSTAPNPAPAEASKSDDDSNEKIYIGVIAALGVINAVLVAGLVFCSVRGNRYKSRAAPVVT
ncbi:hypothetical protein AXG93_2912s1250 [Marchantia polymorpha subsp. ruderalis]|uniref:Malectin-like domain-containing protein n=1 Tax=Marchantia polymorpha subsp. ruderalis TaxID=1480154 RepID=A0A176WIJ8_MARPO|nr:hypothetical protein AXG93_2912s1250 [Marchantia polymorpha subsp. ruderalis]